MGDISCDVNGSLACTVQETVPGHPVYVYNPETEEAKFGFEGPGIPVMAVSNLPCELPLEASAAFSDVLVDYIPVLSQMDLSRPFSTCALPDELKRAVILWGGKLTPSFEHLRKLVS